MEQKKKETEKDMSPKKIGRRDILKGLATIPIVGAFGYGVYKKEKYYNTLNSKLLDELDIDIQEQKGLNIPTDKKIRIGVVGFGSTSSYRTARDL